MNEDQLHRWVDGALDPADRRDVEEALARSSEDGERGRRYREMNDRLHHAFDPVLAESIPPALIAAAQTGTADARRELSFAWLAGFGVWRIAAALLVGVALGYIARGALGPTPSSSTSLAQQATLAYATYQPEVRHPVEVVAAEEKHLVAWLSKRLDAPLRAPSLTKAGFSLLGGRLLPGPATHDPAPVALLMYENAQGKRLSLLVRREARNADTAFRFVEEKGARVFYWIDGPFGYALAGDLPRDELQQIAELVYRQLNS